MSQTRQPDNIEIKVVKPSSIKSSNMIKLYGQEGFYVIVVLPTILEVNARYGKNIRTRYYAPGRVILHAEKIGQATAKLDEIEEADVNTENVEILYIPKSIIKKLDDELATVAIMHVTGKGLERRYSIIDTKTVPYEELPEEIYEEMTEVLRRFHKTDSEPKEKSE